MEFDSKGIKWKMMICSFIWCKIFNINVIITTKEMPMKNASLHIYELRSMYNTVSVCILMHVVGLLHIDVICRLSKCPLWCFKNAIHWIKKIWWRFSFFCMVNFFQIFAHSKPLLYGLLKVFHLDNFTMKNVLDT